MLERPFSLFYFLLKGVGDDSFAFNGTGVSSPPFLVTFPWYSHPFPQKIPVLVGEF
jgi:hypothetical protein